MRTGGPAACLAACIAVAGCAPFGGRLDASMPGVMGGGAPAPAAARAAVHPGQSTKADVTAALGPATVVAFDSGWEVWVYRWPGAGPLARDATELVLLFDPAGVARKARLRAGST